MLGVAFDGAVADDMYAADRAAAVEIGGTAGMPRIESCRGDMMVLLTAKRPAAAPSPQPPVWRAQVAAWLHCTHANNHAQALDASV